MIVTVRHDQGLGSVLSNMKFSSVCVWVTWVPSLY